MIITTTKEVSSHFPDFPCALRAAEETAEKEERAGFQPRWSSDTVDEPCSLAGTGWASPSLLGL